MKIAVLTDRRTVRIVQASAPCPAADEAVIRIRAVGICGSDMHMFRDGLLGGIRLADSASPLVPGHEAVGVIEAIGNKADASLIGARVLIEPAINCGRCSWCLDGTPNVCPNHVFLGLPPRNGALQEQIAHPVRLCVPVPDSFSDDEAVLMEPLAIALHAVDRAEFRPGYPAVIQGAGPIGLCILMLLAGAGASPIIVIDRLDYRLDLARRLGAGTTLNVDRDNVVYEVRKLTGGHGSPYVFEAAGDTDALRQMVELAAPNGVVAAVGIPPDDEMIHSHSAARRKGLDIRFVRRSNRTTERAIHWALSCKLPLNLLVTHHWPLAQTQQAFDIAADYGDNVIKGVICPS